MSKIVNSYYKLITNFQDDLKGSFLTKLKRRQRTLNLLAWKFLLNKVKPVRLDDLLLPRLKRRSTNSFYTIQLRKLRFFYGFYRGYKSVFFKRLHRSLKGVKFNRVERGLSLLELRLDTVLVRIGLFSSVLQSRDYIKQYGLILNSKHFYDFNYVLKKGDIFSVLHDHKFLFKLKLLIKLNPSRLNISYLINKLNEITVNNKLKFSGDFLNTFILADIGRISFYERLLSSSLVSFDLNILKKNRSIFFLSYFPRFLESNFKTFEFVFSSSLRSFEEIKYPFKLKTVEIKRLIESTF